MKEIIKKDIMEYIDRMDERQLRVVYFFVSGYMGD